MYELESLLSSFESEIRSLIYSEKMVDELFVEGELVPFDEMFFRMALKPQEFTLLHRTIFLYLCEVDRYAAKKLDKGYFEEICSMQDEDFELICQNHSHYTESEAYETLFKGLSSRIFNRLYTDRQLMGCYSRYIASRVQKLEKEHNAKWLKKDGVLNRAARWPKWLRNWLVCRDKNRCASCGCSFDNQTSTTDGYHVDHMIPLKSGGTNDPTNLQLLCPKCNGRKSVSLVEPESSIVKFVKS